MAKADDPAARAASLHEAAIALREAGRYAEGERRCRRAAELFEALEGAASPDLANALVEHGRLLDLLDRHTDAEAAFDRALGILRPFVEPAPGAAGAAAPGDELDPDVRDELMRLHIRGEVGRASAVRARGRLDDAEAACRLALERAEAAWPAGDLLVAEALNALGVVHKFQGRFADAEPLYRRALALVEAGGGDTEQAATLLHNLGGLYHARGDHAGGEPLARRSVELREVRLGRGHPAVAADREAWGALLQGLGRLADAERAYTAALATFESELGPDSLEASSSLAALGSVQHAQGRLDEALVSYRRARAIREARLDPLHYDLGLTLNNLAMLLEDRGERVEARALLTRALAIFTASLGPAHPHTEAVRNNIAALET